MFLFRAWVATAGGGLARVAAETVDTAAAVGAPPAREKIVLDDFL